MSAERAVVIQIGIDENGRNREAEIRRRHDSTIYVRIHQTRQDCYLEVAEVAAIIKEMRGMQ